MRNRPKSDYAAAAVVISAFVQRHVRTYPPANYVLTGYEEELTNLVLKSRNTRLRAATWQARSAPIPARLCVPKWQAAQNNRHSVRMTDQRPGDLYQHPLAYLLGLEGISLLRAFGGQYDRGFTLARIAECKDLLRMSDVLGEGGDAQPLSTQAGYRGWAPFYDSPGNQLIDIEQPIVQSILETLPVGSALDAACGTGRHSSFLVQLGHAVLGVDNSPEMLDVARAKVPGADFREGEMEELPLEDNSVDLVVCALALTHAPDLGHVLTEFTRVLRPGGHLVTSDSRGLIEGVGLPMPTTGPDGQAGYMPVYQRRASDYLREALRLGLQVRRCEEPLRPSPLVRPNDFLSADALDEPVPGHDRKELPDIWDLHRFAIDATNAVYANQPAAIIWQFQLSADA